MKHPLWILNISLLALFLFAVGFVFFSGPKLPSKEDIMPEIIAKPFGAEAVSVNIAKIYENDLFGTYRKEMPAYQPGSLPTLPEPPAAKPVSVPPLPTPQFLDPLNITLKGIIIVKADESENRAIIEDKKTNKESTYRVGQKLEDAQLIRILSNKVIFLRSNGQQEVLYLREKDAKLDPTFATIESWSEVIRTVAETEYEVAPREFVSRISNLAQFIDLLDLTTVYNEGKSYGTRIGQLSKNSVGTALGFQKGDIVMTINGIPATTTSNRYAIYKQIENLTENDSITVTIERNKQSVTLQYLLKEFKKSSVSKPEVAPGATQATVIKDETVSFDKLQQEQRKSLSQRNKLAPTVQEIREKERQEMLSRKKPAARSSTTISTE